MEYALLTEKEKEAIRRNRLHELEVAHFQMSLEEAEEAVESEARTSALTDLARRISSYRAELDLVANMTGDSLERTTDGLTQP